MSDSDPAHDHAGNGERARAAAPDGSDLERAEQLVAEWGERLGSWLSRSLARAREEAEDIWAEAQERKREL